MKKLKNVLWLALFISCTDQPSLVEGLGKDVRTIQSEFEKGYSQPKREAIGMTATLLYLQETNQIDSISIDLYRLLQIQDSIASK